LLDIAGGTNGIDRRDDGNDDDNDNNKEWDGTELSGGNLSPNKEFRGGLQILLRRWPRRTGQACV
jgi:hypothetical protein